MKTCDGCGSLNTGVVDSREEGNAYVRRRRKCNNCGSRWTTYEVPEEVYQTLRNSGRAVARLEQAQREILSAVDVLRETLPIAHEEQLAAEVFTSPNPRTTGPKKKSVIRPPFVREAA